MTAVVGRALGWVASWGSYAKTENIYTGQSVVQKPIVSFDYPRKWTSWMWGGWRHDEDHSNSGEEYWEAQDKQPSVGIEDAGAGKKFDSNSEKVSSWSSYFWSWFSKSKTDGPKQQKWKCDVDGDFSDYGTPPPSPTPSAPLTSPFRLFAHTWNLEILPEHHEICFNLLRHLFDLFTVGFLWTVSPPTKLILEVLGVQGPLRLWLHGMAMFFVSTIGMAGLLWLIQEYLPQFALIYGIVQAVVISVSVRQSVILGTEEESTEKWDGETAEGIKSSKDHKTQLINQREKIKMN